MGDFEPWQLQSNGHLSDPNPNSESSLLNPDPTAIDESAWQRAEEAAQEVICHVRPTIASEKRRKAVVDYVNFIITRYTGIVVSPFGSVPLKTYLPDGDIDLTALAEPNSEHSLPDIVCNVLQMEENNPSSTYEVKDVQLILAEVKLVKCLVQNIVVDISFNQVGGLFTLCFLEEVDVLIGKDHLFKHSIMLIKSWCYYESRILGAHHGLFSTYALETLILYIFNLFHKTLDSPLMVLYRFLDYYSKFDWENQGISVQGPVSLASLPEIVAEAPEVPASDLLIQEEFVNRCLERYQVKIPNRPNDVRDFCRKNLNIVDPLKPTNNLGRSISRGNFYRIRSAFIFGAQKLSHILSLSPESIPNDIISTFFRNTLKRHGSDVPLPDVPSHTSTSHYTDLDAPPPFPHLPMQYPNGPIPYHRPSYGYPPQTNLNGFISSEPDSSEPGPISPSISYGSDGPRPDVPDHTSTSPYTDPDAPLPFPHLPVQYPNGPIPYHRPSYGYPQRNLNGFTGTEPDSSEPLDSVDGFADITGDNEKNIKNLYFAISLFENKQQPGGGPISYRPFINNSLGRGTYGYYAGVNGVLPAPHFPAGGNYVMYFMPPSGNYYAGEDSPKTRGTGTYLPLLQQHQRQQQHQRSKSRNELPPSKEEPIFDPQPSTSIYRPPHIPYRSPNNNNNQWIPPHSPHLGIRADRAGGGSSSNNNNNGQLEFGSVGPVVIPTNGLGLGLGYASGLRSPPPPPPVPGVVQTERRSSSVGPNRSRSTVTRAKARSESGRKHTASARVAESKDDLWYKRKFF